MQIRMVIVTALVGLSSAFALSVLAEEPAAPTKATYMITGLHCPPCTRTVEGSLARIKGVKSVSVDYRTTKAKIEFDESVLTAQSLAAAIAGTPHMMGGGMQYGGWLALNVPSLTDAASGQKVKDAVAKLEGVKTVAVYPTHHSAAVLFAGKGALSSKQVIEALAKEGIEATNF